MNVWDILLLGILAVALILAARRVAKARKSGGCGCGCAGCTRSCADRGGKRRS